MIAVTGVTKTFNNCAKTDPPDIEKLKRQDRSDSIGLSGAIINSTTTSTFAAETAQRAQENPCQN